MPGADLRMLVEEQAALRRVAVTVATESTAERVFDVVTEEVARLLGADAANLVSFGPRAGQGVVVGKWSEATVPPWSCAICCACLVASESASTSSTRRPSSASKRWSWPGAGAIVEPVTASLSLIHI